MGHQVARHPWRDAGGDAGWPSAGRFVEACHRRRGDAMGDHSKPKVHELVKFHKEVGAKGWDGPALLKSAKQLVERFDPN